MGGKQKEKKTNGTATQLPQEDVNATTPPKADVGACQAADTLPHDEDAKDGTHVQQNEPASAPDENESKSAVDALESKANENENVNLSDEGEIRGNQRSQATTTRFLFVCCLF